jgi:inner membrane protein
VNENLLNSHENTLCFFISDFKGLYRIPDVEIGEKRYQLQKKSDSYNDYFQTTFNIPADCKLGDTIRYALTLNIKGTEELTFKASGTETTLAICSPYPHPSFKGDFLPESREVGEAGFSATWRVLGINTNENSGYMGVRFVDPVNSYQQSMRSAKYGIIIIIMVFIAGLLVELLTKRGIHPVQYAIIGVSLVLFYSLLLSFSEFIPFGISYALAAAMTISALTLYFKAILKHKSAYVLGAFVTLVYIINYMLLQMETYALIAGSMTLFVMLCVMMYLTTGINNKN